MKLSEYKKVSDANTAKTSDITRQLALAGVAIIWIFRVEKNGQFQIENFLIYPPWSKIASSS